MHQSRALCQWQIQKCVISLSKLKPSPSLRGYTLRRRVSIKFYHKDRNQIGLGLFLLPIRPRLVQNRASPSFLTYTCTSSTYFHIHSYRQNDGGDVSEAIAISGIDTSYSPVIPTFVVSALIWLFLFLFFLRCLKHSLFVCSCLLL